MMKNSHRLLLTELFIIATFLISRNGIRGDYKTRLLNLNNYIIDHFYQLGCYTFILIFVIFLYCRLSENYDRNTNKGGKEAPDMV